MNFDDLDKLSLKDLTIFDKTWSTVCYASLSTIPISLTYAFVSGDVLGLGAAGIGALASATSHQYSTDAKVKIMERKLLASSIVRRHRKRHK